MRILLFLFLFLPNLLLAQNRAVDSLKMLLEKTNVDSIKFKILNELAYKELYKKPQKAIEYCAEAQKISQKMANKTKECSIVNLMGGAYWVKGDLDKALACFQTSLKLSYETQNDQMQAKNMGNIGLIYSGAGNKKLAKISYERALRMYEKAKNFEKITVSLSNIGVMHLELGEYDSAAYCFDKVMPMYEKYRPDEFQNLYINLADLAFRQKDFVKAEFYLKKCLAYSQKYEDTQTLAYAYFFMADLDLSQNRLDSAAHKAEKAIKFAQESESKETISKAYKVLSKVVYAKKNYKDSYKYYDLYVVYRDSVESELAKNALQLFEYERKNGEVATLKTEQLEKEIVYNQENTKKNNIILASAFAFILLTGITFFVLRGRRKIQKAYEKLSLANEDILQKNEEINQQKEEIQQTLTVLSEQKSLIEKKNEDMIASINYARRIQYAILPQKQHIREYIADLLLFYQPKDIVSGDFYWLSNTTSLGSQTILAVADCTGHGVPGAFMTVIGNNLLDQIINKDKIFSPAQILKELDFRLLQTLKQQGEQGTVNDGMDISILKLDLAKLKLIFANAKRPLWIFENGKPEPTEYKGNKFPIGSSQFEEKTFTEQEVVLQKGDLIYSFTDGYADQFGAEGKFTIRKFRRLLCEIHQKDFAEQEQILATNLEAWKGKEKQTDDILVLGIRV